jgi:hypothetical protein
MRAVKFTFTEAELRSVRSMVEEELDRNKLGLFLLDSLRLQLEQSLDPQTSQD